MARNFVVIVGINNYKKIQPLKYAKSDAERMRDYFMQDLQVSPENLYFFSDDSPCDVWGRETQPTYSNLETFFTESFETPFLESGDTLWFYFSGHGMPYEGRDCLLPIDFSLSIAAKTTIPLSSITDRLRRSGADNVVMLIDACRSDGAKNAGMGIGEEKQQGVITFFSCSPSQVSYEIDEIGQGAFTNVLLEALRIQGEGNCATVERFYQYLRTKVPRLTQHYKNYTQTPYAAIEPATKLHYILLPKFANLTDISELKNDAFKAEVSGNIELAQQIWKRVNAASSGTDLDVFDAFVRLANKQSVPNSQLKERVRNQGSKTPSDPPVSSVETNSVELVTETWEDSSEPMSWWLGFILVLGSSAVLSLQNVLVKIIYFKSNIFGLFDFGGFIEPNGSNSFIILFLRMLFATPIMWIVAKGIFRVDVLRDLQYLLTPRYRLLFWRIAYSALLQFASFAFFYMALGVLNPGLAATLFFIFPTVTVLMAWFLFGDRPSTERWNIVGVIYVGIMLTYNIFGVAKPDTWGVFAAMLSGIAFAGYIITSQTCFKQLNPVSFTAINFTIILLLCFAALPFTVFSISLNAPLVLMCFLIALTTLGGYLLTSFGTKLMGAAQASIVTAIGPVFTTFLAFTILGAKLESIQLLGVFLVSGGVGLLSIQNMYKRPSA